MFFSTFSNYETNDDIFLDGKKNLTDSRFRLPHFLLPQHYTQIPIYLKHHSRTKVQACKTRVPLDNCCHRLLQSEKKTRSRGSFSKSRQAGAVVITQAAVPAPCSPTPHAVVTRYDVFFWGFLLCLSPFCSYSLLVKLRVASRHSCAQDK